jgi:hypothetical protein
VVHLATELKKTSDRRKDAWKNIRRKKPSNNTKQVRKIKMEKHYSMLFVEQGKNKKKKIKKINQTNDSWRQQQIHNWHRDTRDSF